MRLEVAEFSVGDVMARRKVRNLERRVQSEREKFDILRRYYLELEAKLREARADLAAIKETTMEVVGAHSRAVAELAEVSEARTTAQLNIAELVENAQRMKQRVASLSAIRERAEAEVLRLNNWPKVASALATARFILGDAAREEGDAADPPVLNRARRWWRRGGVRSLKRLAVRGR